MLLPFIIIIIIIINKRKITKKILIRDASSIYIYPNSIITTTIFLDFFFVFQFYDFWLSFVFDVFFGSGYYIITIQFLPPYIFIRQTHWAIHHGKWNVCPLISPQRVVSLCYIFWYFDDFFFKFESWWQYPASQPEISNIRWYIIFISSVSFYNCGMRFFVCFNIDCLSTKQKQNAQ